MWESYRASVLLGLYHRAFDETWAPITERTLVGSDVKDYSLETYAIDAMWSGEELGVIWGEGTSLNTDAMFARLDSTGAPLSEKQLLWTEGPSEHRPRVSRTSSVFPGVWPGCGFVPSLWCSNLVG